MERAKINYLVDLGLLIAFLSVFITGIIKYPGLMPQVGVDYRALPMHLITPLHDSSGVAMGVLVFVHLVLHWGWIVGMSKSFFRKEEGKGQ